jgi:hypothetical protein
MRFFTTGEATHHLRLNERKLCERWPKGLPKGLFPAPRSPEIGRFRSRNSTQALLRFIVTPAFPARAREPGQFGQNRLA